MSSHSNRSEERAKANPPVNFTCGKCKQVVPYSEGYKCPNCDIEADKVVE